DVLEAVDEAAGLALEVVAVGALAQPAPDPGAGDELLVADAGEVVEAAARVALLPVVVEDAAEGAAIQLQGDGSEKAGVVPRLLSVVVVEEGDALDAVALLDAGDVIVELV